MRKKCPKKQAFGGVFLKCLSINHLAFDGLSSLSEKNKIFLHFFLDKDSGKVIFYLDEKRFSLRAKVNSKSIGSYPNLKF